MRMDEIAAFDPVVEETERLLDLWNTMEEAALQAAGSEAQAAELRALILQAAEVLPRRAGVLFQKEEEYAALAGEPAKTLAAAPARQLPEAVRSWRLAFASLVLKHFLEGLRGRMQLSAGAAARAAILAETVFPLDQRSRGAFLLETALRCGVTDPEGSAQGILRALVLAPDLLRDKGPQLKDFVYQPEAHPQAEFCRCPSCGGAGSPYRAACSCLIASYEPMFLPAKLWMRCQDCGTLYTRWFPREFLALGQEPRLLQPRPGWLAVQGGSSALLRSWNEILNAARDLSPQGGTRLLEVGVGNGHLIAAALEMGYQVTAVELLAQRAQETADLLGLPVLCGDFLRMEEGEPFDLITMGDVLEHLQNPAQGLQKARHLLRKGGVLWLSTPNYESAFSRLCKVEDPMWREPTHITYFSRESLTRLVEQTGFRVVRYSVSIHYNGSMELLLQAE